jgi:cytochrome d ubiquinol oxidase subunit I
MDAVLLARLQFAFAVSYHFFFVPLSIGLGLVVVLFERRYYRSKKPADRAMSELWIRIFTATFAVGVATGITNEFAFGTNWASYSRFVGDIFGAPLAAEGLFAFFVESTFLGVLLLGRNRVSRGFYYTSTWLVWGGSLLSAVWIIIANSWMQTPAGFKVVGTGAGRKAVLTDFMAAALNPSVLPRYFHTINAVLITAGFAAAAVGAYHLLKGNKEFGRRSVSIGLGLAMTFSIIMLFTGHWQSIEVVEQQPVKAAAFEGHWNKGSMQVSFAGIVNKAQRTTSAVTLQCGTSCHDSFTYSMDTLPGLNQVKPSDRPPLQTTFQTYHAMIVGFVLLVVVSIFFWAMNAYGDLGNRPWLLKILMWVWLVPEAATQAGWFAAEVGRQPFAVSPTADGFAGLRTADAVSSVVPAYQVAITLTLFVIIYTLLFVGWARVVLRAIKEGPVAAKVAA